MVSGKRFILPAVVIAVLVFLLVLIGWLAFRFFDALAQRSAPVEPFFGVTTSVVQRTGMLVPQTHAYIELPADDLPGDAIPLSPHPTLGELNGIATPAACINYGDTITIRPAWHNPVEYTASFGPDRVRVFVRIPSVNGGMNHE